MTKTVLITGASGKIGTHAARAFGHAGWTIKRFQRGTNMTRAAQDVDVIVNGMNPANYHNWAQVIPEITEAHIEAAKVNDATVLIPGNVYNFGNTPGVFDENTPQCACSRKGDIRIDMEARYAESGVRTLILRAGNFIDPDANSDVMSTLHLSRINSGKILSPGATNVRQAWCFLPDWAEAAVQLCDRRTNLAVFEDIPFKGHTFSVDMLSQYVTAITGKSVRVSSFPWWVMRLASPFWGLAREMQEMRYLWNLDHALSDAKLARLLPDFEPTPIEDVIRSALGAKGIKKSATAVTTFSDRLTS
ncbi:MAG: epimerase [Paracoccaceae bacterium]